MKDAFFTLHEGLDREGPGLADDVAWAIALANVPPDGRICDAGCGPGADIPALLAAVPKGKVVAVDSHKPFIDEALARIGLEPRLTAYAGNMKKLKGPFDLIWSAGALYFLGVVEGLMAWRPALVKGTGHVAFSEPCWFTDTPSDAARAFWHGEDVLVTDAAGIDARVAEAGYRTVATRVVSDAAWEAYYTPMQARIAVLRPGADADLTAVLDEAQQEIDGWRAVRAETGYLLCVVRPA